jgi:hypothetical protein
MGTEGDNDELREVYGPDEEPAPAEEPVAEEPVEEPDAEVVAEAEEPAPEVDTGPATEADPGPPTEPVVVWEAHEPGAEEELLPLDEGAVVEDEVVPAGPSRVEVLLAAALFALFFVPWFDVSGFVASSGYGMLRWTSRFLDDLPSRDFDVGMLVPYLAVLIPLGAVAIILRSQLGYRSRRLAIATGLVAPFLLLYGLAREGGDLFKVLEAGAYLTLAFSLALLATGFGVLASRWGLLATAVGTALLVILAFALPAALQDPVDSRVFAAYAADRTSLTAPEKKKAKDTSDDEVAAPTTTSTLLVTASTEVPVTTSTTAGTATTTVVATTAATVAAGTTCPTSGPVAAVTYFHYDETAPSSNSYLVDVRGTVDNRTKASMDVSSIEVDVLRGGTRVGHFSVAANRTLAPGQTLEWFQDDTLISSPDSPPTSAVVSVVPYTWHDAAYAGCARP